MAKQLERTPEMTPREKALIDAVTDDLSPVKFFGEMKALFGTRRMVELIGYAVLWGVAGIDDVAEMRNRYEDAGLSEAAMYRAMRDYRRFGTVLLEKHGRRVEMKELLRRMRNNADLAIQ